MKSWLIAVGASGADGLQDICLLLSALPADLDAVTLIVLHRPSGQQSHLREVLARRSPMPVRIAVAGQRLLPGIAYIGEPGAHLTILETGFPALVVHEDCTHRNRTVDLLFQSVADSGAPNIIGVILAGSLDDGSRGLAAIHSANGYTMALEPEDNQQIGMPENAICFDGPVDVIGSVSEIAEGILRLLSIYRPDSNEAMQT